MAIRKPRYAIKAKDFITKAKPTYVKSFPSMESFGDDDFKLSSEDLPLLVVDIDRNVTDRLGEDSGHYKLDLAVPIKGRYSWYVFHKHVEEVPLPEFFIQGAENKPTVIKQRLDGNLSPEEKFNFNEFDQPLQARWIRPAGDSKHIEFSLIKPVNGKHNWFAFLEHVVPSKVSAGVTA